MYNVYGQLVMYILGRSEGNSTLNCVIYLNKKKYANASNEFVFN